MQNNSWTKSRKYGPPKSNRPMYPLNAPGMPMPGADFIKHAIDLGDDTPDYSGTKVSDKRLLDYGPWLHYLYGQALYEPNFSLNVDFKSKTHNVKFIPGHIWDADKWGPKRAKVMIIGKLPGKDEQKHCRNLIGPSGDKLIETFDYLNQHEWRNFYVTNLVKFPHPDPFAGGTLPQTWVKDCLPLLHQELRLVRPDYVLCLGSDAAKYVLNKTISVTSAAGEIFNIQIPLHKHVDEEPRTHDIKVMVVIHPAAVLRSPDMETQYVAGLAGFNNLIRGIQRDESDIEHHFVDNAKDLSALITKIKNDKNNADIAWDSEWHGDHPFEPGAYLRTIQFSWQPKKACCVILRYAGGEEAFKPDIATAIDLLKRVGYKSEDWPARAIGHFFRADLPWLIDVGLDLRPEYDAPVDDPDMSVDGAKFGWEKTATEGGFDTGLAAHAHTEAGASYKLEVLANQLLGVSRYDRKLRDYIVKYCKEQNIKTDDLEGYGFVPSEILHPYAAFDASTTRELFELFNKPGGLLDFDRNGQCCREAFWIGQRASLAVLEMEMSGIDFDKERAERFTRIYSDQKSLLVQELRELINWPKFNPNAHGQCRELLFGVGYSGSIDKTTGVVKRVSPLDVNLQNLTPIKTTGKRAKMWEDVVSRGEQNKFSPSTDKEVLGILSDHSDIALRLRDIKFISQLLNTNLRLPSKDKNNVELVDEDGELLYEKGLISTICYDGRVRTHLFQTKETARMSSARPNLQALSKRREDDYRRICGSKYEQPLRSVFKAAPGYVLIEADYSGAELFITALLSRDKNMLDHCLRGQLKKSDPKYYDIHSNIAVNTFHLDCEPTKAGLESIDKAALRVAAKNVVFGSLYGRGPVAIARQAQEEHVNMTPDDAAQLLQAFFTMYPGVPYFMEACKYRVTDPGWICNPFGRFRRFNITNDRKVLSDMERQAMNFCAQSTVADSLSRALDHLYNYRIDNLLEDDFYKILLAIHDAVLFEVPIENVATVVDDILPLCMSKKVDIYQTDLDGVVYPNVNPFNLGIEVEVMLHWGEKMTIAQAKAHGIPERFAH